MKQQNHKALNYLMGMLVVSNTAVFLVLANLHVLSTNPKSAVFIDFWGRFTVYSMWFIGFSLYVRYISPIKPLKNMVLLATCFNIPLFLLMAYFNQISNTPDTIVMVDFWGRITVYSLWVLCYESYQNYVKSTPVRV